MAYCGSCQMSPCECNDDVLTLPTGSPGLPGVQGVQGAQGLQGIQGIAGNNGVPGPTTVVKLAVEWNTIAGSSVVVITGAQLTSAGMLKNVYQIDSNGNITTSALPVVSDFVFQIWKFDAGNYVDAEVANLLTAVLVSGNGNISVIVNQAGLYRMIIIG